MSPEDMSIVLSGAAGQGIKTVEKLLTAIFKESGYFIFSNKEYMSRIRGGNNTTQIRVSPNRINAPLDRIDILIPLNPDSTRRLKDRISENTIIIGDRDNIDNKLTGRDNTFAIPINREAEKIGGQLFSNVVAASVVASIFDITAEKVGSLIKAAFSGKGKDIVNQNLKAVEAGYSIAGGLSVQGIKGKNTARMDDFMLVNGSEVMGMGAIAGGCNFISAYPMSPSTGVFSFLSQHAADFGIIAEQAEDEISAINMVIGSWYAGARGLANTSGGGFALMEEGISLAGMTEIPVVIHLAQRPGPATGLPTRTEQGDLELAVYSGHGEFPRAVFTPGTFEDLYIATGQAFDLADAVQVPVIILTDQYLLDSYQCVKRFDTSKNLPRKMIVETDEGYKRYASSENGVSSRGVPGHGGGLVGADSDEHDRKGHITEDLDLRVNMVDKRMGKKKLLIEKALEPELYGAEDYNILLIGCGSTCHAVREAVALMDSKDISFLYLKQVHPFHRSLKDYIEASRRSIVIENNATSQLARLIEVETGLEMEGRLVKYNGLCFTVEELAERIKSAAKNL